MRRLRAFLRKRWWRVLLIGLLAYIIAFQLLVHTGILNLTPMTLLLASAIVPVTFVVYCWEQNAFADMPASVVGLTFFSGAVLGLTLAGILEPLLLPHSAGSGGLSLADAFIVGFCEETAKVIAVLWFLRDRRLRSELDGLILGAASGMGFATFETAGYGFQSFLLSYSQALLLSHNLFQSVSIGLASMNATLLLRMALAVFGHGVWTAILCAAIWRDRGAKTFRLTGGVVLAYLLAIGLHMLWDLTPSQALTQLLGLVGLILTLFWYLAVGLTGILILRFFIWESLERAKLGRMAAPLKPLPVAMASAFVGFFRFGSARRQQQQAYNYGVYGAPGTPVWPAPQPPQLAQPPYIPRPPQANAASYPPRTTSGPNAAPTVSGPSPVGTVACPRCGLISPMGTQVCPRCGATLTQRP